MQLFYSTASPYARKVVVAAREAGVIDQIEIVTTYADPINRNDKIVAANPIGKIPTLVLDDGRAVFDSRLICDYIASIGNSDTLLPADPDARLSAQTIHALGDGILDASLLMRYETFMRPEEFRWDEWTTGQRAKIISSLDYLENHHMDFLRRPLTIGHIAISCSLAYLDFRQIIDDWKSTHPKLASWHQEFAERESMKATEPN